MKIAIISDLHLGFRQYGLIERENDFYNQLYKVRNEINKHEPDMVIIAGDLFDKPNPSPAAINAYREGIGELDTDIICTIKGNHTMILRDNHYSIDDFFEGENIFGYHFLDDSSMNTQLFALETSDDLSKKYENIKVHVDGITYRQNSNIDEFLDIQKEMAENCSDDFYNILVVHQSFKEFCGFTGEELSIEDIDYSNYDAIICGHIHSRFDTVLSDGTKFIQPGSIERMNTTEALDEQKNGKGFYLLDTKENSLKFYNVENPRKFILGNMKIENKEDLENHLEELDDTINKFKVAPIISYKYENVGLNIEEVRDNLGLMKKNILLNRSNIDDKSQEEVVIEIKDNEMPTVLEAIKDYGEKNGFTKEECDLAIDLHGAFKNNEDNVEGLLENFYDKNYIKELKENNYKEDLKEILEYFEVE